MIAPGKLIKPSKVEYLNGGTTTRFHVPQLHMARDGSWVRDGFLLVICKGYLDWNEGDMVFVKKLNKVSIRDWKGKTYVSVYAEAELADRKPTPEEHEDDLAEDLF